MCFFGWTGHPAVAVSERPYDWHSTHESANASTSG